MKVLIFNKETDFDVNEISSEELFEFINWELQKLTKVSSSVIVEGTEIHNNHIKVVEENWGGIERIEVIAATKKELAMENIELIRNYLDVMVPEVSVIAKEFAGGIQEESWVKFEGTVRGLIFVEGVMGDILGMLLSAGEDHLTKIWGKVMEEYGKLNDILKEMEERLDHEQLEEVCKLMEKDMETVLHNVLQTMKRMK